MSKVAPRTLIVREGTGDLDRPDVFGAFELAENPDRPGAIFFSVKPQQLGSVQGEVGLTGRAPSG